jgi:hypothetical protein
VLWQGWRTLQLWATLPLLLVLLAVRAPLRLAHHPHPIEAPCLLNGGHGASLRRLVGSRLTLTFARHPVTT